MRAPHQSLSLLFVLFIWGCNSDHVLRAGNRELAEAREAASLELARIGQAVPDFDLSTTNDTRVRLSDYLGKTVVLEWLNPDCPFTRHAHTLGILKDYPKELRAQGIVWLGINSASNQKLGGSLESTRASIEEWELEFPVLIDDSGNVGRQFDATTTPEVFLIDSQGVLRYVGAVDNMPFGKVRGGAEGQNYLTRALDQLKAGEPVSPDHQQSYGCRVKYAQPTRLD
jgi:peroxiredoxin